MAVIAVFSTLALTVRSGKLGAIGAWILTPFLVLVGAVLTWQFLHRDMPGPVMDLEAIRGYLPRG